MRGLPPEQRYIRLFVLVIMVNVVILVTMILMIKASYCICTLSCAAKDGSTTVLIL